MRARARVARTLPSQWRCRWCDHMERSCAVQHVASTQARVIARADDLLRVWQFLYACGRSRVLCVSHSDHRSVCLGDPQCAGARFTLFTIANRNRNIFCTIHSLEIGICKFDRNFSRLPLSDSRRSHLRPIAVHTVTSTVYVSLILACRGDVGGQTNFVGR